MYDHERDKSAHEHDYIASRLVPTMQRWVNTRPVVNVQGSVTKQNATNRPTSTRNLSNAIVNARPSTTPNFTPRANPYARKSAGINLLGCDAPSDDDDDIINFPSDDDSVMIPEPPDPSKIPIPVDLKIFSTVIEIMKEDPNMFFDKKCIVCQVTQQEDHKHRFDQCPVLKDHNRLKELWIQYCLFFNNLRQSQREVHKKLNSIRTQRAKDAVLNAIKTKRKNVDADGDFQMEV